MFMWKVLPILRHAKTFLYDVYYMWCYVFSAFQVVHNVCERVVWAFSSYVFSTHTLIRDGIFLFSLAIKSFCTPYYIAGTLVLC